MVTAQESFPSSQSPRRQTTSQKDSAAAVQKPKDKTKSSGWEMSAYAALQVNYLDSELSVLNNK